MVLMYAVKATGTLRVSEEGELEGLDLHEHGTEAYPEMVIAHNGRTPALVETADAAYPTTA
jgi:Amt family ammonium transporter